MTQHPIDVGSDRQLFIDDLFFDSRNGVELRMHKPRVEEVAVESDRPWESGGMHYSAVLQDRNRFRMWYRADTGEHARRDWDSFCAYAESADGVTWEKPNLGIFEYNGSTDNNLFTVSTEYSTINPSVIIDENAPADERYKMILQSGKYSTGRRFPDSGTTIMGYTSPDGLHWKEISEPLLTEGPFDSHNILIRDDAAGKYVIYCRGVANRGPGVQGSFLSGYRSIRRSESSDFKNWTPLETVVEADDDDPDDLHFYTNAAVNYERAARAFFMFPMVLYTDRRYPTAPQEGLSDVHLIVSRDGVTWDGRFREAFLSPDLDERNWCDCNPIMGSGILRTGPAEMSMYYSELLRSSPATRLRRCTMRSDGFVSVHGPYVGWGEFTTPVITFTGSELEMNYKTTGGGAISVELQNESGSAIPGFTLEENNRVFGDKIEGLVSWKKGSDVSALAGRPARMRVKMRDADLYAFRFK